MTTGPTWQDAVDDNSARIAHLTSPDYDPDVPDPTLPISDAQVYRTISITEVGLDPADPVDVATPVDLLDDAERVPPQRPAVGVMLHLEQAWRMKGLVKGRLMHSLCLAPGEVTQVAMVDWRRSTSSSTRESVGEQESTSRSTEQSRVSTEITSLVASELQTGGSATSSFAAQANLATSGLVSLLGVGAATSANLAVGATANWSLGARDATATSKQNVRRVTAQHTSNVRSRVATIVQEVTQSETEQYSSRVVANYNHMHALNIQYYEVLQSYELSAVPVLAERCIFLPMSLIRFTENEVSTFAVQLAAAARAMGRPVLAGAIDKYVRNQESGPQRLAELDVVISSARLQVDRLNASVSALLGQQARAQDAKSQARVEQVTRRVDKTLADAQLQVATVRLTTARMLRALPPEPGGVDRSVEFDQRQSEQQAADQAARAATDRFDAVTRALAQAQADYDQATVELRWTRDELQRQRAGLDEAVGERERSAASDELQTGDLLRELNEDQLAMNQALWLQMDPATVRTLVNGLEHQDTSIAETIDPVPVAVVGTYVGYRWGFPRTPAGQQQAAAFRARYVEAREADVIDRQVLPTAGLFAESVLGRAVSAEELDLTRFWKWDEDTIPLLPTAIGELKVAQQAQRAELVPGALAASGARLSAIPDGPAGPSRALTGVLGASLFRDMTGAETIGGLLTAAQKVTGAGAQAAQEAAHQNISAFLDHAEKLLPQLSQTAGSGTVDPSVLGALRNALSGQTGAAAGTGTAGAGTGTAATGAEAAAAGTSFDAGALLAQAAKAGFLL